MMSSDEESYSENSKIAKRFHAAKPDSMKAREAKMKKQKRLKQ